MKNIFTFDDYFEIASTLDNIQGGYADIPIINFNNYNQANNETIGVCNDN